MHSKQYLSYWWAESGPAIAHGIHIITHAHTFSRTHVRTCTQPCAHMHTLIGFILVAKETMIMTKSYA